MKNQIRRLRQRNPLTRWNRKQRLASPGRYYGDGGTIHHTGYLDVEVHKGRVVSVWFRCQPLAFKAVDVHDERAAEMDRMMADGAGAGITGVEVHDGRA